MALDRDQVVDAAWHILQTYGLGDLSMRRLARELGVQPGALYWHVANKQELLTVLAERMVAPLESSTVRPAPGAGGRPLPVQLEVEDDGPGLPENIADRVFEPFVSGRENGTGLGLALVAKIAADHGAWIAVDSRPGRTVFRLSLPRADADAD